MSRSCVVPTDDEGKNADVFQSSADTQADAIAHMHSVVGTFRKRSPLPTDPEQAKTELAKREKMRQESQAMVEQVRSQIGKSQACHAPRRRARAFSRACAPSLRARAPTRPAAPVQRAVRRAPRRDTRG